MVPVGWVGTLFPRMAALPCWSKIPSLPKSSTFEVPAWKAMPCHAPLQVRWPSHLAQEVPHSLPSSWPVFLARAAPSFFTSTSATPCQPPKDSCSPPLPLSPSWCRQMSGRAQWLWQPLPVLPPGGGSQLSHPFCIFCVHVM